MYPKILILSLPAAALAWAGMAHGTPSAPATGLTPPPASAAPLSTAHGAAPSITLGAFFERVWARQPEARATAARRDAALATREAAASWSADAPALSLLTCPLGLVR